MLARHDYLGGSDRERLRDFNAALADDSVDAIWCVRGGYGAMRLLPHLDYASLRRRPRVLLGYSDVTALHAAVGTRCGLVTYHGPTAREKLSDFSRDSLVRAVVERRDPLGDASAARTIRGGRAAAGSSEETSRCSRRSPARRTRRIIAGALLVLEDVGEPALSDRPDAHAAPAQRGARSDRRDRRRPLHGEHPGTRAFSALARRDIREAAEVAGVPAIAGAPIGHIGEQWTLPLGAMAELDADARSLHVEAP